MIVIRYIIQVIVSITISVLFLTGCVENTQEDNNNSDIKNIIVGSDKNADFKFIQEAINFSVDGDTIIVQEGLYNESLYINKSINLISDKKNECIIIGGFNQNSSQNIIIQINADKCLLDGFKITRKQGSGVTKGIKINSSYNKIVNNTIYDLSEAIFIDNPSQENMIIKNNLSDNHYGLKVQESTNNTISENIISSNILYGIYIHFYSKYNIVRNNTFYKNDQALRIKTSTDNEIYHNCFYNNTYGIYLCCSARYNLVYNNNFIENSNANAYENYGLTNYLNHSVKGGNYWDDYEGLDEDENGFGDSPYQIEDSGNGDNKPLIYPVDLLPCP
jgi:parallel beta-helix repeat protein